MSRATTVTLTDAVGTDEERMAEEQNIGHVPGVRQLCQRIEAWETFASRSWHGTAGSLRQLTDGERLAS
jgi:hypothetical protein